MKCQLVGFNSVAYEKNGKDHSLCELHFVRSPFSSEKTFEGNVTKKFVVFDKVAEALPDLIIGGLYSVEVEISGKFESLVEMVLLSAPK